MAHRTAENKLQETDWGKRVVQVVGPCVAVFWEEQCDLQIAREHVSRARWMLLRRGVWTAEFKRRGAVPRKFECAFNDMAALVKVFRENGRPSKHRHHDLVGASVFVARFFAGDRRGPRLALIADYLNFPEWGYPLPRDRVRDIAYQAIRCAATEAVKSKYVLTATAIESFRPLLYRVPASWTRRRGDS